MITLRARDVVIDSVETQRLKNEFQSRHCVLLHGLLDGPLLQLLRPRIENGTWTDYKHEAIGKEVILDDDYALNLLHFAVNAPAFLDAIRSISGCDQISRFHGRIFRMNPGPDHYDSWHDDMGDGRLAGMSINLSFEAYEGGQFEMRELGTEDVLTRIATFIAGNATVFRIGGKFQHRVAPLAGRRPRTAFAGWFRSGKADLVNRLRRPDSQAASPPT